MKNFLYISLIATLLISCAEEQILEPSLDKSSEITSRSGDEECLTLIYPVSLSIGDQLIVLESPAEWDEFWEEWKQEERDTKPQLIYPLEVKFKDEVVLVDSEEDMIALKKKCSYGDDKDGAACFKVLYPVSLELPDGTTIDVQSDEEWHQANKDWVEDNPDSAQQPKVLYPIEVVIGDKVFSIDSEESFIELKEKCKDIKDTDKDRLSCFSLIYPVTLAFPDGTTLDVADAQEWKEAVRDWMSANPDSDRIPKLQYPVDVKLRDGSLSSIDSVEEMMRLKKRCAGDEKGGRVRVKENEK